MADDKAKNRIGGPNANAWTPERRGPKSDGPPAWMQYQPPTHRGAACGNGRGPPGGLE